MRSEVRHEQAFLSNYLREHHHLEYWDSSWCVSFKYHCLQKIPFAYFIPPKKPIHYGHSFMNDITATTNDLQNNYIICMKWGTKYSAEYVNRLLS